MGKYAYCIHKPYKVPPTNHTNRDYDETMPRLAFCEEGDYPTTPVRVVVRHIESIPPDYQPHTDLHYHDRDELFIFVSEEKGGLEAEVTLGDEVYRVKSPVTVLLPKEVPHKYALKKGHGFFFIILQAGTMDYQSDKTAGPSLGRG
jgi:hypothetical protein